MYEEYRLTFSERGTIAECQLWLVIESGGLADLGQYLQSTYCTLVHLPVDTQPSTSIVIVV